MRRFLIRLVQVFALAIIGTGFLADTSFAAMTDQQTCEALGGEWIVDTMSYGASLKNPKISCIYSSSNGGTTTISCYQGKCMSTECNRGGCSNSYSKGYKDPPHRPTKRDGTTIDTVTAGTCAQRGLCAGGIRSGAPTTSIAPLNGALNAFAPSRTTSAVSTGAALNTQAATGLGGIDTRAAIPSQLQDHLNRMRR
jgi:hypothetical protein